MSVLRDVIRRWPLVLAIGLLAAVAAAIVVTGREESHSATARLLITPIAQYDETFLGTSLIRDSGDANRTPPTVAELVESSEVAEESARTLGGDWTADSVRGAVEVLPVGNTNVLGVTAEAAEPADAERVSSAYAEAVLTVRWRTIAAELDDRIAALAGRPGAADPQAGDPTREIRMLQAVRRSGADPTLKLEGTSPAVVEERLPAAVAILVALLGGLFLGGLAAVGLAQLGLGADRRARDAAGAEEESRESPDVLSLRQ